MTKNNVTRKTSKICTASNTNDRKRFDSLLKRIDKAKCEVNTSDIVTDCIRVANGASVHDLAHFVERTYSDTYPDNEYEILHEFCTLRMYKMCMAPGFRDVDQLLVAMAMLEYVDKVCWACDVGEKIIGIAGSLPESEDRDEYIAYACCIRVCLADDEYEGMAATMEKLRDRFPLQYVCFTLQTLECCEERGKKLSECIQYLEGVNGNGYYDILISEAYGIMGEIVGVESDDYLCPGETSLENKFIARHILRKKGLLEI